MNAPEPLWKVEDVARYLAMSRSWVYKEAEAGRLPCMRIGAVLRFEPSAIRKWLERQASRSAGPRRLSVASSEVDAQSGREA